MVEDSPGFDPRFFLLGLHCDPDPRGLVGYQDRGQESVWVLYAWGYHSDVPHPSGSKDQLYILDSAQDHHWLFICECDLYCLYVDMDMSLCVRKPTIWVSDQVRHKLGCIVTEKG